MLANPRNRVVVFRLSGHEYLSLKDACNARGARNISDFTRSEILSHLHFDRFAAIEERIAELQSAVMRLNELLESLLAPALRTGPETKSAASTEDSC
jgi:hypothetical protein